MVVVAIWEVSLRAHTVEPQGAPLSPLPLFSPALALRSLFVGPLRYLDSSVVGASQKLPAVLAAHLVAGFAASGQRCGYFKLPSGSLASYRLLGASLSPLVQSDRPAGHRRY